MLFLKMIVVDFYCPAILRQFFKIHIISFKHADHMNGPTGFDSSKIILCTGKSAQQLSISLYILSRFLIIISTRLLPFIGKQALQSVYSQIPFPGPSGLNADST
jgi:hypothetical protein